jgi:hypothetical protein
MMHWQKLIAASAAMIGAAVVAAPVSAMSGLPSHELVATGGGLPQATPVGHRHGGHGHGGHNDFNIHLGFPLFAFGGYPYYRPYHRPYYYDDYYEDSYLHCHGRKYWRYGKLRCTGRWHRHY